MTAFVVLDRALFDVDALVAEAAGYLSRRLGGTPPLDPTSLPADASAAIAAIDAWAGTEAANWRAENARWFEAHAPVRLSPDTELNARLRRARRAGTALALVSALQPDALDLVAGQLGFARSFVALCGGDGDIDTAIAVAKTALQAEDAPILATRDALDAALAN